MLCLDKFNKRMSYSGGSLREEYIFNTRELLKETFADDPSYIYGLYFWRLGLKEYTHEKPIDIRLYSRTYSAAQGVTIKFQSLYNTPIIVGDVIYDAKENEYLICTEAFNIDGMHYKGKFTLCNWILKWQKKDGTILEYPCYDINSTQYNSGEQYNRNFTIESSQHMITLPCDENTVALCSPQRFYLDKNTENPSSYIVTQNDTTSLNYGKKGLVRVTVYAHPNNPETDRPELGICDYIDVTNKNITIDKVVEVAEVNANTESIKATKAIIEYNTTTIKSGGDLQIFTSKFYDDKGNEVVDIVPHWTIICDFSDKLQVKELDKSLSIGIDNDDYIDEEFKLILSNANDKSGSPSSTLLIKVESLL